jgi:hypothetical protein
VTVVLPRFLAVAPDTWSLVRAGVAGRDAAKVRFAAHRLHGQVATFDAMPLMAAIEAIETAAEESHWTIADESVVHAERELNAVLHDLRIASRA